MQFFCWREEHIRGFVTVKAAVRDIESAVGLRYVVRVAVSEKTRDAVNGRRVPSSSRNVPIGVTSTSIFRCRTLFSSGLDREFAPVEMA